MYNDKYIKAKISLYNVNFCGNKTPRKNKRYTCLFIILIDYIVSADKKCYPQVFLEECQYAKNDNEYN